MFAPCIQYSGQSFSAVSQDKEIKDIPVEKRRNKNILIQSHVIVYQEKVLCLPNRVYEKLLELTELSNIVRYKINIHKLVVFLHTSNKDSEI